MKTTNVLCRLASLLPLLLGGLGETNASLVYDNGSINNSQGGSYVYAPYSTSSSFTLSSPTTLAAAQVGLYGDLGASPLSLNWSIGTSIGGSEISSGAATLANSLWQNFSAGGFSIYESTFALSGTLSAGTTYYLTLYDAVASDGGPIYWNTANGTANGPPPPAYLNGGGYINDVLNGGSSFQLYNTPVPEPSTCIAGALLLLPFGASTLRMLRKRQSA